MKLQNWDPDLRSLVDRIEAKAIDLQPDFQRQEIWSRPKQRKLIDTVLREWSIPPVHFVEVSDGTLEVLDGQQRLAAIRDFCDDRFKVEGDIAPLDASIQALDGLTYSKLPPPVKNRFDRYTIRSFRLSDYKPQEPSELFYRLNQPVSLTSGEKRNALYGTARKQLKELVDQFTSAGNSIETLGFSNARMSYDDILARLVFFVDRGSFATKAAESAISDRFRDEDGFSKDAIQITARAIQEFSSRRASAVKVKLNKASLLSWLLFFCRDGAGETATGFLKSFESVMPDDSWTGTVATARRVFVDRASLRVTDVSSVVYRDVALWLACRASYPNAVLPVDERRLWELEGELASSDHLPADAVFERVIDIEEWARL